MTIAQSPPTNDHPTPPLIGSFPDGTANDAHADLAFDETELDLAPDPDGPTTWNLIVDEPDQGHRLDRFVVTHGPGLSRMRVQALISSGEVRVNGELADAATKVRLGQTVTVIVPAVVVTHLIAEAIPIDVVYEDADIAIVNKAAGMVVHPAPGHPRGTLVNALLARLPDLQAINGTIRPGIVHRLDRDTSGLIVVAKHERALAFLQAQFRDRTVEKRYLALVDGHPRTDRGAIDAPIGRRPDRPDEMALVSIPRGGRNALTYFRTVENFAKHTLIECKIVTGRTHQIRVHLASISIPVTGDTVYGRPEPTIAVGRQFLHAAHLAFRRPDGEEMVCESPLPADLQDAMNQARH